MCDIYSDSSPEHQSSEVLYRTITYRSDSDIYKQFVNEYIQEDPNTTIGLDDIFPIFRGYLQLNDYDQKQHNRRELERRLTRILGKANTRKKWKGWCIAPNEETNEITNKATDEKTNKV